MRWLIACVLVLVCPLVHADGRFYGEIQLAAGGVQHSEVDFFPVFGSISVGAFLLPNIGVEVFADTGLSSDKSDGFDLDIEQAQGIALRLQSPPNNDIQGYVVLGYVNYTLDQDSLPTATLAGSSVNEDFRGARISVGLMQRLQRFPNLLVSAEYRHYNADEPLRVDALLLGLRVNTK
ncbi:MAG: outer membrane beta-barrel protein [Granulosicoccus sp.]